MRAVCIFIIILPVAALSLFHQNNDVISTPGLFGWLNPRSYIRIFLWTRENLDGQREILRAGDRALLQQSHFNSSNPVKMLIHGFAVDGRNLPNMDGLRRGYLLLQPHNILVVDWGYLALPLSFVLSAAFATDLVSDEAAKLLDFLSEETGISLRDVHILGVSMGAHTAGFVGKRVRRGPLGRITGLDPANVSFRFVDPEERLSPNDALFVDVIHSGIARNPYRGFGHPDRLGHVDFYPNKGEYQPGCGGQQLPSFDSILCSHGRAAILYTESLFNVIPFMSCPCPSWDQYESGECPCESRSLITMGEYCPTSARGKYYLTTNNDYPFSRGEPVRKI